MDMLPINPSNNLIKPTIATANDGGSKSQSGYIQRQVKKDQKEKTDEIIISSESSKLIEEDFIVDEKNFLTTIKEFILSFIEKIKRIIKSIKFPERKQKLKKTATNQNSEVKNFLGYTQHQH